jgi:hypothetical protein
MRRLNFDERVEYKVSTHACIFNYSQILRKLKEDLITISLKEKS